MQTTNKTNNGTINDSLKVPFQLPSIDKAEEDAVLRVLRSNWLTTGKETLAFEKEFSHYVSGGKDDVTSLAVNSNTSGMILAMDAVGVKEGTAVITTPYTFISTSMCAKHLGGDVHFADIEADNYSIDPNKVEDILKKDTAHKVRAIVPVHIAGNVCDMTALKALAEKYDVRIIEDAAHSLPSKTKNGFAGTLGDIGVFSFYATKTLSTAEGGMVTARNPDFIKRMMMMRSHGMDRTTWDRYTSPRASWEYDIIEAGYKFNLPDILSAIGREQLKKQDKFLDNRVVIADMYNEAFKDFDFIELPPNDDGNCWYMYLLRLNLDKLDCDRTTFAKEMQAEGIGISVHFIPHFHFTYWKNRGLRAEDFPNAEKAYQRTITIPLYPDMTAEQVSRVVETVKKIGEAHRK